MKITVVQDWLRSGGTERQSVLLANAFAQAGHKTTLLTFRPGGALRQTVSKDVSVRALQPFDTGLDWFAPRLASRVSQLQPDVVLAMGRMANCYAGGLQTALAAAAQNTAVVATMRTGKPLPRLFRLSLQKARHVVANSREARDNLVQRHGVPADKITVIHNSLVFNVTDRSAAARGTVRSALGASANTSVLLCVAMFRPEKNQAELIEIAAGFPADFDWHLWLAGDGPARADCERIAGERGVSSRVRFLGWKSDPSALYAAANLAVHASWSESLSNFLIEAQANGLPAVVYAAQGISECFVPGSTGEVIPRDDRAAFRAAVLRYCRASCAEQDRRSELARAHAAAAFDPARQVDVYLRLFERLRNS